MSETIKKQKSLKVNAVLNVVKQCSTVIFPLVTYPYISRVLGSDNFGRIGFSNSVIEYGMVFAALGIPTYMVREGAKIRDDKQKISRMAAEVFTISIMTMLIALAAIALLTVASPRLRVERLILFTLSFNIVFYVLGRDWVNTIYEDYLYVTIRYIALKALSLLLIFLFVRRPEHYLRYAGIIMVTESAGYIANIFYTRRYIPYALTLRPRLDVHLKPLMLLFCSTLAIQIYIQSDITILGFMRTDSEVGVYSLASRVYSVIKSVLNAIIMVAIPRISYYIGNGDTTAYHGLLGKLKESLITLLFPCIVGGFALSSDIMYIMGGEEYLYGHRAFEILCVALLFAVLGCYYAQGVLVPNRRENKFFICTSVSALVNIVLNFWFVRYMGIEGAAITTLIAEMLIMASCRCYSRDFLKPEKSRSILSVIVGCAVIFVECKLIAMLKLTPIKELMLSFGASVASYFAVLYLLKNPVVKENLDAVMRKIRS